jgi:hypothetical protein
VASGIIDKKLKDGWNLIDENSKRQKNIEKLTKKYQTEELIELINNVVILNFEKDLIPELREIRLLLENDPNLNVAPYLEKLVNPEAAKKPEETAREMLGAFRKELIVARDLIQKEAKPENEIQEEIAKIDKALRDIVKYIPY